MCNGCVQVAVCVRNTYTGVPVLCTYPLCTDTAVSLNTVERVSLVLLVVFMGFCQHITCLNFYELLQDIRYTPKKLAQFFFFTKISC